MTGIEEGCTVSASYMQINVGNESIPDSFLLYIIAAHEWTEWTSVYFMMCNEQLFI